MLDRRTDERRMEILCQWQEVIEALKCELDDEKTEGWTEEMKTIYIFASVYYGGDEFVFFKAPKRETIARLEKAELDFEETKDDSGNHWLSFSF